MDCVCVIENMFLVVILLGIVFCWINQFGMICDDLEVWVYLIFFGVFENYKVYGCVVLGYKVEGVLLKEKIVKVGMIIIVEQDIKIYYRVLQSLN